MRHRTVDKGTALRLGAEIIQLLPPDISQETAMSWIRDKEALRKGLRDLLLAYGGSPVSEAMGFVIRVDFGRTIEDAWSECACDLGHHLMKSEYFPVTREDRKTVCVDLVCLPGFPDTDEAKIELDKLGYRPADLRELLELGARVPELQRQFPVAALGTVWERGNPSVPFLGCRGLRPERMLEFWPVEGCWGAEVRFAAVPL